MGLGLLAGGEGLARVKAGLGGGLGVDPSDVGLEAQPLEDRHQVRGGLALAGRHGGGLAGHPVDMVDLEQPVTGGQLDGLAGHGARVGRPEGDERRLLGGSDGAWVGRGRGPARPVLVLVVGQLSLPVPVGSGGGCLVKPVGQGALLVGRSSFVGAGVDPVDRLEPMPGRVAWAARVQARTTGVGGEGAKVVPGGRAGRRSVAAGSRVRSRIRPWVGSLEHRHGGGGRPVSDDRYPPGRDAGADDDRLRLGHGDGPDERIRFGSDRDRDRRPSGDRGRPDGPRAILPGGRVPNGCSHRRSTGRGGGDADARRDGRRRPDGRRLLGAGRDQSLEGGRGSGRDRPGCDRHPDLARRRGASPDHDREGRAAGDAEHETESQEGELARGHRRPRSLRSPGGRMGGTAVEGSCDDPGRQLATGARLVQDAAARW